MSALSVSDSFMFTRTWHGSANESPSSHLQMLSKLCILCNWKDNAILIIFLLSIVDNHLMVKVHAIMDRDWHLV